MTTTNQPIPDVPLLRKAVEWAEASHAAQDGEWNQISWVINWNSAASRSETIFAITGGPVVEPACGTSYCIAGFVASLFASLNGEYILDDNGFEIGVVSEFAEKKLGLTESEATDLFGERNSIEDVRRVAEGIAERAGERL